jgi:hypothetical protein
MLPVRLPGHYKPLRKVWVSTAACGYQNGDRITTAAITRVLKKRKMICQAVVAQRIVEAKTTPTESPAQIKMRLTSAESLKDSGVSTFDWLLFVFEKLARSVEALLANLVGRVRIALSLFEAEQGLYLRSVPSDLRITQGKGVSAATGEHAG